MPKQTPRIPIAVRRALLKLGADISAARRRRRLPLEVLAQRALTTRQTISRIEKGDARVAMGTWATVLFALGLAERLGDLAAPARDELGLMLDEERLPARVRTVTSTARPRGGVAVASSTSGTESRPAGSRADVSAPGRRTAMRHVNRGSHETAKEDGTRDDR